MVSPLSCSSARQMATGWSGARNASAAKFKSPTRSSRRDGVEIGIWEVRPLMRSLQLQTAAHHRYTFSANPHPGNLAVSLLGGGFEQAGAAHVDTLGDPQLQGQIRCRAQARQQSGKCDIGTTSCGVFRNAKERREHPSLDIDIACFFNRIKKNAD